MHSKNHNRDIFSHGIRAVVPVFVSAIVFSLFINILLFVTPIYMLQIYDRVIASRSEMTLAGISIIACILLIIYASLEIIRSRLLVRGGILFDELVAGAVFDAVHRENLVQPGAAHAQCLEDIDRIREFLTGAGLITICDLPWFPIFAVTSFALHPWFGLLAICGGFTTLALTLLNEAITKKSLHAAGHESLASNQAAQTMLRNSDVLQAMGMLKTIKQTWSKYHKEALRLQGIASDRAGVVVGSTKFFRLFLQTAVLGIGAYLCIHREISPGSMIAASILIGRALQPIELAVSNWRSFIIARAAFDRIRTLITAVGPISEPMLLPRPQGMLQISDLTATAPGKSHSLVLKGISFNLKAGEVIGIIGPSGAGKSSLARVIVGAWPILRGSVRLDGSDLAQWSAEELGKYIGYLPQDVELFAGTVAENIARFQQIDSDAIISAARLAGCLELIQHLPNGFDTQIGIGSHILSGGQRQRIGLARALYGKPSIVVLDEPNANLDAEGQGAFLNVIEDLKSMRAMVVIVTHTLDVLECVDKILILVDGSVEALGARDEILHLPVEPQFERAAPAKQFAVSESMLSMRMD